jgi:hypothetical protein
MERTWKSLTGGILAIVGGAAAIGQGIALLAFRGIWQGGTGGWGGMWGPGMMWPGMLGPGMMWPDTFGYPGWGGAFAIGAGIALIVVGAIAIAGGVSAVRRQNWGLALAGSILAIPGIPPLGVLALILVAMSRKEFSKS